MQLHIEIDFKYTKDGARVVETRVFDVGLDDMPLILCEALEQEGIGDMRAGITEFLELTEEESRQLRLRHIKQISAAIKAAQEIPNG